MKFIIVISIIILPMIMFYLQNKSKILHFLFDVVGIIAMITFGIITGVSIYQILKENTVFTAAIHGIFLNSFFLLAGAYLGLYFIYRMIVLLSVEINSNS